jgi:hypothetical protein
MRWIGFGWCLVSAITAAIGCAGSQATSPAKARPSGIAGAHSEPTSTSEFIEPHLSDGPPCGPDGPTLELKAVETSPGKPPHVNALVQEVRVRNPSATPVWLLYDLGSGIPSVINTVTVSRTSPAPGALVWTFAGDGGFEAVRLSPRADIVLRALEVDSYATKDRFVLAFATSVTIGDRPAESWAGRAGLSPASGDFTLTDLTTEFERKLDDLAEAPLAARILCMKRFDANDPSLR